MTANRYEIARQDVNCGPVRTIYTVTLNEANRAFDAALAAGAIFIELYDMALDSQVRIEYPRLAWV